MTLQTLGEDEIDTEALQAQIDLSMSFAQDLVTSWIKPSHKLVLNSHKDTERELQEYMRRPPRYVPLVLGEKINSSMQTWCWCTYPRIGHLV